MITSNDNINYNTKYVQGKMITLKKTSRPSKLITFTPWKKNDNTLYNQNDNINEFKNENVLSFLRYHFPLYIFCVIIYVINWNAEIPFPGAELQAESSVGDNNINNDDHHSQTNSKSCPRHNYISSQRWKGELQAKHGLINHI